MGWPPLCTHVLESVGRCLPCQELLLVTCVEFFDDVIQIEPTNLCITHMVMLVTTQLGTNVLTVTNKEGRVKYIESAISEALNRPKERSIESLIGKPSFAKGFNNSFPELPPH